MRWQIVWRLYIRSLVVFLSFDWNLSLGRSQMADEFLLILARYRCHRCCAYWQDVLMGFTYEQNCPHCKGAVEPFNWVNQIEISFISSHCKTFNFDFYTFLGTNSARLIRMSDNEANIKFKTLNELNSHSTKHTFRRRFNEFAIDCYHTSVYFNFSIIITKKFVQTYFCWSEAIVYRTEYELIVTLNL